MRPRDAHTLALIGLLALLSACSDAAPKDRGAEAARVCEEAVQQRVAALGLTFQSGVKRLGSGAWDVEGTVQDASDTSRTYTCGVFAKGDADTGVLFLGAVEVSG